MQGRQDADQRAFRVGVGILFVRAGGDAVLAGEPATPNRCRHSGGSRRGAWLLVCRLAPQIGAGLQAFAVSSITQRAGAATPGRSEAEGGGQADVQGTGKARTDPPPRPGRDRSAPRVTDGWAGRTASASLEHLAQGCQPGCVRACTASHAAGACTRGRWISASPPASEPKQPRAAADREPKRPAAGSSARAAPAA